MLLRRNKLSLRRRRKPPLCVSAAAAIRPEGAGDLARGNHAEFPQLAAVSQAPVLDQKDNFGNKDAASSTRLLPPSPLLPWCFSSFTPPVSTFERAAGYTPHSRSLLPPSHAPLRARDPAWDTGPQSARHLLNLKPVSSLPICLAITELHLTLTQPQAPK